MKNKALFWAIGLLGLAWNGIGLLNFIMQQNPANLEQMPELFRTIVATRPLWATIAFGLAVASGALGSILLLLRHKLSVPVFACSLIAMVAHMFSYAGMMNAGVHFGAGDIALIVVAPVAVAVGLLWWGRRVVG
jgi:hypothetical protein